MGGEVQLPKRARRIPPLGLRVAVAGHQAQRDGAGRVPRAGALRLHTTGRTVRGIMRLEVSLFQAALVH